jgi:hypothetical protein
VSGQKKPDSVEESGLFDMCRRQCGSFTSPMKALSVGLLQR